MKKKWESLTCRQILKAVNILFYGGLGLLVLAWAIERTDSPTPGLLFAVLAVGGAALLIAGLVLAFGWLRCPCCGESLCLGGRLPTSLPNYCPHCGKPL